MFGRKKKSKEQYEASRTGFRCEIHPKNLPEDCVPVDAVVTVRWIDSVGEEHVTTEIFTEDGRPKMDQFEIVLGMISMAESCVTQEFRRQLAAREAAMDALSNLQATPPPLSDHPCSDITCSKCYHIQELVVEEDPTEGITLTDPVDPEDLGQLAKIVEAAATVNAADPQAYAEPQAFDEADLEASERVDFERYVEKIEGAKPTDYLKEDES